MTKFDPYELMRLVEEREKNLAKAKALGCITGADGRAYVATAAIKDLCSLHAREIAEKLIAADQKSRREACNELTREAEDMGLYELSYDGDHYGSTSSMEFDTDE